MKKVISSIFFIIIFTNLYSQEVVQIDSTNFKKFDFLNKMVNDSIKNLIINYDSILEDIQRQSFGDDNLDELISRYIKRYNFEQLKKEEENQDRKSNDKDILDSLNKRLEIMKFGLQNVDTIIQSNNFLTLDIYNPINFTKISHRMPAENGKSKSEVLYNRSSVHYIKKRGVLHLEFDKKFIEGLTSTGNLDLRVSAFIERQDKTIKPLSVLGLTRVVNKESSQKSLITNPERVNQPILVTDEYEVIYLDSSEKNISAEIELSFEEIGDGDVIILQITNAAVNNVGFTNKFEFTNYGWTQGPTSGFSFVRTTSNNEIFRASGSAGYSFRYEPKPSAKFWNLFFQPSFGPEINVLQIDDETLIGGGLFVSSLANTVKFGFGYYLNGNEGETYFSIGLNFIEGYQSILNLLEKTK